MDTSGGWPIVVGVDGSESALDAVHWAAERAREQDGTVRLVAAVGWASSQPMGWQALTQESYRGAALAAAEEHLQAATEMAARSLPTDRIDSLSVTGLPAGVLYDESARAFLLVLGSRGRGGFRGLLLGSTTVNLAAAAQCPVVVVRGPPAPNGPVVVGVDGSPDSESALGFAFEAAARQGAPLLAVRTWADETNHPVLAMLLDDAATDRLEQEALDRRARGMAPEVSGGRRANPRGARPGRRRAGGRDFGRSARRRRLSWARRPRRTRAGLGEPGAPAPRALSGGRRPRSGRRAGGAVNTNTIGAHVLVG